MQTKINLHSVIDLITNSSTEIYTYSSGSVEACKQMVNEFLKTFASTVVQGGDVPTCDDIFELSIHYEGDSAGPYDEFPAESFLVITPKSPEYSNLALLVHKFLYSTDHEACYNG